MNSFKIFVFFILSTTVLFATINQVKKVEIKKGELRLEFTKPCEKNKIKTFTLSNPYRKVFDFKNTRLEHTNIFKNLKNCKVAQYKPNVVRVVIKSEQPYYCAPYKPMLTDTKYHIPLPLNFTLSDSNTVTLDDKKDSINKSTLVTERTNKSVVYRSHKDELVVIDAGHGGHDSGALGGGKKEKDLVLSIAKKVAKALRKRGYPVYLTRTTDRFLKLSERTHIADKKGSVAFISIHANAAPKKRRNKAHGIETFFLQNTRDARSQRIAARENISVLKGAGTKLSKKVILDSVLSGPKIIESNKLAIDVHRRIMRNIKSHYKHVKDGGVRHAPFYVLVGASRPSILVEVGYISHPSERKRLLSSRYQNLMAKGIAEGVSNYLNNRRKEIE